MGNCTSKNKRVKVGSRLGISYPKDSTPEVHQYLDQEPCSRSEKVKKGKILPLSIWDNLDGDDPMWDTDSGSCFSDETEEYPLSEIVSDRDQAWDTDAASCFSSIVSE